MKIELIEWCGDREFAVKYRDNNVGIIRKDYEDKFVITRTNPRSYETNIPRIKFNTKEEAGMFLASFVTALRTELDKRGIPEDVDDFLESASRDLYEEYKNLTSRLSIIKWRLQQMVRIGKKHGTTRCSWYDLEEQANSSIKSLLKMEVEHEGEIIPFLSEAYLYDTLGKDSARTVRACIRDMINTISPELADDF